jgi:mono/diheme cytochrome c family protein
MDPKGAGSELQESRGAAPLLLVAALALAGPAFPGLAFAGLAFAGLAFAAVPVATPAPSPPAQPITYTRDVAPLFGRWCVSCHGGKEPHAGLSLDSLVGVMRGGDTGPVVVPGDPNGSLLVNKIERRHRPAMPPRRKLPPAAVALIRAWIAAGAPG